MTTFETLPSVHAKAQSLAADPVNPIDLTVDLGVDPSQAYERGKVDINFFAALAMPEVFLYALPSFYILIWQILVNRKELDVGKILRFALGLPRGHAKTTFCKILLAWLIVYDKATFILIICATEDLAENLLADLNDILSSPNMEAVFGDWSSSLSKDTSELKKAMYHGRPVVLAAKGAGSSLRGLNIKNARPDVIFLDDMQTRENDESPTERTRLLRWMIATALKVIAPRGDRLIIYVGNMYSDECILYQLKNNPKWVSLVTGAILENGQPLWPELFSLQDLMEGYFHDEALGQEDLWFAEIMNDPKNSATTILPHPLERVSYDEVFEWDSTFITIDPAGFRKASDQNVIVGHGVYNGRGHVLKTVTDLQKPDEIIKATLIYALEIGASVIGVESVAYQQTLCFWLNYFIDLYNITGITVVELKPHGRAKETRIRQFVNECYAGNYCIYDGDTRALFVWQANKYKLGKKDNKDDLLDAVAYGLDIRNEFWQYLRTPRAQRAAALEHLTVVEDNTPF